ncbi:MAG: hypothetical protein IKT97_07320 [Spirochaetia bacterium]|nr:hypothetical protein [Spirochaetia bacterium]
MNDKPTLLYASPFPPLKSGISDYSVILVKALSEIFNITLYIDNYEISPTCGLQGFPIKKGVDNIQFDEFDYKIYNIGNQPDYHGYIYQACLQHPGLVILHDLSLYYLFIGCYTKTNQLYSKLLKEAGLNIFLFLKSTFKKENKGPLEIKSIAGKIRLNEELLKSPNKIMVHSEFAKTVVGRYTDKVRKINHIKIVDKLDSLIKREELLKKYKIPTNATIISSFGFIAETKLNHIACKVINRLVKKHKNICYVMVGDGAYVNPFIDDKHIFKTGFVGLEDFDSFISYSDLVLNLRYPSMGETSGTLIRALEMSKCCIINDDGWFHEIPNDCAIKIGINNIEHNLEEALEKCLGHIDKCKEIGINAQKYIDKNYYKKIIIKQIEEFLNC